MVVTKEWKIKIRDYMKSTQRPEAITLDLSFIIFYLHAPLKTYKKGGLC